MTNDKLRRQIVFEAARLMYSRQETEYFRAKMKAGRKICGGWVKTCDLPSNAEIRDEIQRFAALYEGESRFDKLREMRLQAPRMMRLLEKFRPRIIGSTLTGHVRQGSDIDLHVFASTAEAISGVLDEAGMHHEVSHKRVRKHGEESLYTHVHVPGEFETELTVYSPDKLGFVFKSSITGKAMERASLPEFEEFLKTEYPDISLDELEQSDAMPDRFLIYRALLAPLASVKQGRKYHPEGDALYHSLQVFDLAADEIPYDEEFLLAALLHDIGKAIDPEDHVGSGLQALEGFITERTKWFIEHHMEAQRILDGTIGARAHRRLRENPDYDELVLLARCDRDGREPGVAAPELEDALETIRDLAQMYG
jgi:hypothetical protein